MREDIITMVEANGKEKDQKDKHGDGHTHTRRVLHTRLSHSAYTFVWEVVSYPL